MNEFICKKKKKVCDFVMTKNCHYNYAIYQGLHIYKVFCPAVSSQNIKYVLEDAIEKGTKMKIWKGYEEVKYCNLWV